MDTNLSKMKANFDRIIISFGLTPVPVPDDELPAIYNIFSQNIVLPASPELSAIYLFYAGVYYDQKSDSDMEKKYYQLSVEKKFPPAMNNLAYLYRLEDNYATAEKYYLMAIENGCINAIFNLAVMYDKTGKSELALKYFAMDADNNHHSYIRLNLLLLETPDIAIFIQCHRHLNSRNTKILNKAIAAIEKLKHGNFNGRLMQNMDCTNCNTCNTCIFLYCGHSLCTECFRENKKCGICTGDKNSMNDTISDSKAIFVQPHNKNSTLFQRMRIYGLSHENLIDMVIPNADVAKIDQLFFAEKLHCDNSNVYIFFLFVYWLCRKLDQEKAMDTVNYLIKKTDTDPAILLNMATLLQPYDDKLTEKLYLILVERNNPDGMFRLAEFNKITNKKMAKKYYKMAANEYHSEARRWINDYLERKFDVHLLIESESFLNEKNTHKLNKLLVYIADNPDEDYTKYINNKYEPVLDVFTD